MGLWLLVGLLSAIYGSQGRNPAPSGATLELEWERSLGPAASGRRYAIAVCPDGTTYVTDRFGRFAAVRKDGTVLFDSVWDELRETRAIACAADGHLYAATGSSAGGSVIRLDRDQPRTIWSRMTIPLVPNAITSTGPNELLVTGISESDQSLHIVRDGALVSSWGAGRRTGAHPASLARVLNAVGSWKQADEYVLVPPDRTELHVYRPGNDVPLTIPLWPGDGSPSDLDDTLGPATPGPTTRVDRGLRLADGTLLLQVTNIQWTGANSLRESSRLWLVRRHIDGSDPVSVSKGGAKYGILRGVDESGSLFFSKITTSGGFRLVKARLRRGASQGQ